jgi:hypothetical protein
MDKATAQRIIQAVLELSDQLNSLDGQLRGIGNINESRPLLRSLATIMAELDSGLIRPLVKQYPDLDPDRVGNPGQ